MNIQGSICDKFNINFNYNTEATFDFDNQLNLDYSGKEDDILQKLEAGNVTLPLNSTLISGSQSLFGIKSELKFGKLTATTVLSQQKGQKKEIEVSGGAQINEFEISPFSDQAAYEKITIFNNEFISTNRIILNQSLKINPKKFISDRLKDKVISAELRA